MDVRGHLAERLERGQPIEEAIRQFGDPAMLAESYLAAVPLISGSFFSRAVAKLIDMLAIAAAGGAVVWLGWLLLVRDGASLAAFAAAEPWIFPWVFILCALALGVLIPGYFVVTEFVSGQTLGKRVMGLRVVKESGARISFGQSFVRQLPLMAEIFVLDVVFALFTEKSQRAFELISKTRVVRAEDGPV
jgi:uncharacterized RDD family membrane protein YckC